MCYPKPGPRCSGHAKIRLDAARVRAKNDPTSKNKIAVLDAMDEADATPVGLNKLDADRRAAPEGSLERAVVAGRLTAASNRRENQIAAYKEITGRVLSDRASESAPDQDTLPPASAKAAGKDYEGDYVKARLVSRSGGLAQKAAGEKEAAKIARAARKAGVDLDELTLDEQARQQMLASKAPAAPAVGNVEAAEAAYDKAFGEYGAATAQHGEAVRRAHESDERLRDSRKQAAAAPDDPATKANLESAENDMRTAQGIVTDRARAKEAALDKIDGPHAALERARTAAGTSPAPGKLDRLMRVNASLSGRVAGAVIHGNRFSVTPEQRTEIEDNVPVGTVRFFRDGPETWVERND